MVGKSDHRFNGFPVDFRNMVGYIDYTKGR